MARVGQRPERHDDGESNACAQSVDQFSAAHVHERVGKQKCRLQRREPLIGKRDVSCDRTDGDWKRLAVEIADCDRNAHQDGDPPAQQCRRPRFCFDWNAVLLQVHQRASRYALAWTSDRLVVASARRVVFTFLRPGVEDVKASVGMGRQLQTVRGIGAVGIRDELVGDIVRRAAFFGKVQLPEIFKAG